MNQETNILKELQELNQRVAHLENVLEKQKAEKAGPLRVLGEAAASLLFGLLIVGPAIAIAEGIIMLAWSWLGGQI